MHLTDCHPERYAAKDLETTRDFRCSRSFASTLRLTVVGGSLAALVVLGAGCAKQKESTSAPTSLSGNSFQIDPINFNDPSRGGDTNQRPAVPFIRIDVWHLSLPYGTVSRNDDFWKRVDEQC